MKKIISLILSAVILLSFNIPSFAAEFSDFTSAHWAYSYVSELVNDGTINGYTDGTFRPEGTVTRAEFVKMIGEGNNNSAVSFDDVSADHWAYKYIISSGLKPLYDNMFMPDTPITRGDVAELLWQRAGSAKGITAPPVVHRQSNNFDAVSWVYTNGIMVGDDYVDLRLKDTLTRAEASALIVRSRNVSSSTAKTEFKTSVDQDIFEITYNAFKLTDKPYDANATLTNGEVAMAVAKLMSCEDIATYPNVSAEITFDHPYAQPINMLARYYLGLDKDNAKYADKNATLKEAVAALMFGVNKSSFAYVIPSNGETYPTYKSAGNADFDKLINTAYANGIWFTTPDKMTMDSVVTMEDFACLVLQFNGYSGFHRSTSITAGKLSPKNEKIRTNTKEYPKNYNDYRIILSSVPNKVYEAPFNVSVKKPADSYLLTNSYRSIFTSMFSTWVHSLSSVGYNLEVVYYPGIAVDNGNGYTLRVQIKFTDIPANTKLGDLIICQNAAEGEIILNSGDAIYADVETGTKVSNVTTGIDKMSLVQIIY